MTDLCLPNKSFLTPLEQLYKLDTDFLKIEERAGTLTIRSYPPTYESLVRIIIGQQLSTRVADTIFSRLCNLMLITPENTSTCSDEDLRAVGLSRAKVNTCKDLANEILQESLCFNSFLGLSNQAIATQLIQIKGIGNWTAAIFLLFCLERLDALPVSDLAIQVGYQRLKELLIRPSAKELTKLMEPIRPYGGVAAHLLWHYYRYLNQK